MNKCESWDSNQVLIPNFMLYDQRAASLVRVEGLAHKTLLTP